VPDARKVVEPIDRAFREWCINRRGREDAPVRTVQSVLGVAALAAGLVYWNFGTISPCGVLREAVRQRDGLAAVLPDGIVDLGLAGQYGTLSPGRCLAILMTNLRTSVPNMAQASPPKIAQPTAPPAIRQVSPAPAAQDALQWAAQVTAKAANECKAKRLSGELPSRAASAQCANPPMLQAFNAAHYRYMDLIQFFATKRLEVAKKIDHGDMTEQQGEVEIQKAYASVQADERQRDAAAR
jgi:hypothetical protein